MRTAKDLMTRTPLQIQTGAELRDVVDVYLDKSITAAPVIDSYGELVGILGELDLIRAYLSHYLQKEKHEKVFHHQELLHEAASVNEDESLGVVVKVLLNAPTNRVLVKNANGKVTGIISPKDVLSFLTGEKKKTSNLRKDLEKAEEEIKNLRSNLENIQEALSHYRDMYNESPAMMHSVDGQGKIVMANASLHKALGYDENELLGHPLTDLYAQSVHHEAIQGLQRIIKDGYHHTTYTTLVKKSGEKVRADVASRALFDETGHFMCTITATRIIDSDQFLRSLHGVLNGEEIGD